MAITSTITLGLAALDRGVHQSIEARKQQQQATKRQSFAQQQAQAAAQRQQKLAAQATAAANRRKPDIGSILASEAELAKMGPGANMLTGPRGVRSGLANATTLLGE